MTIYRRAVEGAARRSRVERANDNTLEIVIFSLRALTMLAVVGALLAVVAVIWTGDLRWLATLVVAIIIGGVSGWLGFWTFGNQGWRNEDPQ